MRYAEDQAMPLANTASDGMLLMTAVLGVLIGLALIGLGRFGKQMWMWVWGVGLVLVSAAMGWLTWIN